MPFFWVDDQFHDHRKVRRLGKETVRVPARVAAAGLWVLSGSWAGGDVQNGFVPDEVVEREDPKHELAKRLVAVGLWIRDELDGETGYRFHDWLDWNESREKVVERRQQRRESGRKGGLRSGQVRRSKVEAPASSESEAGASGGDEAKSKHPLQAKAKQDVEPLPLPTHTQKRTAPNGAGAVAPSEINAGTIVAAWTEVYESTAGAKASGGMRGQVGREARQLLEDGADPELVLQAAREVAEKGRSTLEREYGPLAARSRIKAVPDADEEYIAPQAPREVVFDPDSTRLIRWHEEQKAAWLAERGRV